VEFIPQLFIHLLNLYEHYIQRVTNNPSGIGQDAGRTITIRSVKREIFRRDLASQNRFAMAGAGSTSLNLNPNNGGALSRRRYAWGKGYGRSGFFRASVCVAWP
jgi:hypothetical protein